MSACQGGTRSRLSVSFLLTVTLLVGAAAPAAMAAAAISEQGKAALVEAVNAEYRTLALYKAIAGRHKDARPFTNWSQANRPAELQPLFAKYSVPVPPDTAASKVQAPASMQDACRVATQSETALVAMYDRLIQSVKEADIVTAFTSLREGAKRRLQALERQCR